MVPSPPSVTTRSIGGDPACVELVSQSVVVHLVTYRKETMD